MGREESPISLIKTNTCYPLNSHQRTYQIPYQHINDTNMEHLTSSIIPASVNLISIHPRYPYSKEFVWLERALSCLLYVPGFADNILALDGPSVTNKEIMEFILLVKQFFTCDIDSPPQSRNVSVKDFKSAFEASGLALGEIRLLPFWISYICDRLPSLDPSFNFINDSIFVIKANCCHNAKHIPCLSLNVLAGNTFQEVFDDSLHQNCLCESCQKNYTITMSFPPNYQKTLILWYAGHLPIPRSITLPISEDSVPVKTELHSFGNKDIHYQKVGNDWYDETDYVSESKLESLLRAPELGNYQEYFLFYAVSPLQSSTNLHTTLTDRKEFLNCCSISDRHSFLLKKKMRS